MADPFYSKHTRLAPLDEFLKWSKEIKEMREEERLYQHLELAIAFGRYSESMLVSRDSIIVVEGELYVHPFTAMKIEHNGVPFYTRMCLGAREAYRDSKKFAC